MGVRTNRYPSGMLSVAMLATAGLLASVSVGKVTRVFMVSSRLAAAAAQNGISTSPTQTQIQKALDSDKAVAEELKKANLFAPPPPKRNPVQEVFGILGSEALINGQWYKAGDKVQDANIVAVESTHVVVEWNGQRTDLYPIQAAVATTETSSRPGGRARGPGGGGPGMMGGGPIMTSIGGAFGGGRGGRGGMFGGLSDDDRQRIQNMSPDDRRNFFMQQFRGGGMMGGGMMGGGMMGGGMPGGGMPGGGMPGGGMQGGGMQGGGMQGGGPGGGGGGGGMQGGSTGGRSGGSSRRGG